MPPPILERIRHLAARCRKPSAIASKRGLRGEIPETPKPGDPLFRRVRNTVVGSNRLALDAAARPRARAGLPHADSVQRDSGRNARDRAHACRHRARSRARRAARRSRPPASSPAAKPQSRIKGDGLGGRNQEFVLAAAIDIAGLPNAVVFSAGTDGTDGPTDAAGAIADGATLRAQSRCRDAIWTATIHTIISNRSAIW